MARNASSAREPPASHAADVASRVVRLAVDSTRLRHDIGRELEQSLQHRRAEHAAPSPRETTVLVHPQQRGRELRSTFLPRRHLRGESPGEIFAASLSPERRRAHAARTAATTPARRSRSSEPKSGPSSCRAVLTWSPSRVAPKSAWRTKLAVGCPATARIFPRKNRRKISPSTPRGAARMIASNRWLPLRLSTSCFTSDSLASANSSPSFVPSAGAHPR